LFKIRKENWKDYLHQLSTFQTIADFWSIINTVEPVNRFLKCCRYYIFKVGVSPLWEDKSNQRGYQISLEKKIQKGKKNIQNRWQNVVASLIGESINGIEVVVRAETCRITF
jgi:translation initiation factor 4E